MIVDSSVKYLPPIFATFTAPKVRSRRISINRTATWTRGSSRFSRNICMHFFNNFWMMVSCMCSDRRTQFKIFNSVVEFVTVFMVNSFFGFKMSSERLLHYPAMLINISSMLSGIVGVWAFNHSVSIRKICAALPVRMFFARSYRGSLLAIL